MGDGTAISWAHATFNPLVGLNTGPRDLRASGRARPRLRATREDAVALTIGPVYLLAAGSRNHRLGAAYWGDETRVLVPVEAGPELVNPLTGGRLAVTRGTLPLARAVASFPVTLLPSAA